MAEVTTTICPNCAERVALRHDSECPSCGYDLAPSNLEDHARNIQLARKRRAQGAPAFTSRHLAVLSAIVVVIVVGCWFTAPSTDSIRLYSDGEVLALRVDQVRLGVYAINLLVQVSALVLADALLRRRNPPAKWQFRGIAILVLIACGCIFLMWASPYQGNDTTLIGASAALSRICNEISFCFLFTSLEIIVFGLIMVLSRPGFC